MKKLFFIPCILILFSSAVFALDNYRFTFNANGGTFLIDKTGNSFDYGADFGICFDITKPDGTNPGTFFINCGYNGATFKLDSIDGILNNGSLRMGIQNDRWSLAFGGASGGFPETTSLNLAGFKPTLNDISYNFGHADFSYRFTDDICTRLYVFSGNQKSKQGDLYWFFGHFDMPSFGGGLVNITLPYDLFLEAGFCNVKAAVFSQIERQAGEGTARLFNVSAGKNWQLTNEQQLSSSIGFVYCGADGILFITASDQPEMLFPFSYFKADLDANFKFITMSAAYSMNKGDLAFAVNTSLFMNVYTNCRYFYNRTYKNNLFFDGSVASGSDTISFSRFDSLLWLDAKLEYRHFYLSKKLVIPLFSRETKSLFRPIGNPDAAPDSSQVARYLKTALLSGLSLGISLYF